LTSSEFAIIGLLLIIALHTARIDIAFHKFALIVASFCLYFASTYVMSAVGGNISTSETDDVLGQWRKLHTEELNNFVLFARYYSLSLSLYDSTALLGPWPNFQVLNPIEIR
jgi:hypothetical protein